MVTIDEDFAVDFSIVNYGKWMKKVPWNALMTLAAYLPLIGQNIVSKCKGTIEEVREPLSKTTLCEAHAMLLVLRHV